MGQCLDAQRKAERHIVRDGRRVECATHGRMTKQSPQLRDKRDAALNCCPVDRMRAELIGDQDDSMLGLVNDRCAIGAVEVLRKIEPVCLIECRDNRADRLLRPE